MTHWKITIFCAFLAINFALNATTVNAKDDEKVKALKGTDTQRSANLNLDFMPLLAGLSPGTNGIGILQLAEKFLQQKLHTSALNFNVSEICLEDTEIFLDALLSGHQWAVRMIDAMGKPGSGVLDGNLKWLGSYDECFAVDATVNRSGIITSPFSGQYCSASFKVDLQQKVAQLGSTTLQIGTCFPYSCSDKDVVALLNSLLSLLPVNTTLPEPDVTCLIETKEFDTKAIVALVICAVFGFVMVVATTYDVIVIHWLKPRFEILPQNEEYQSNYKTITQTGKESCDITEKAKAYQNSAVVANDRNVVASNGEITKVDLENTRKEEPYRPGKLGQVLLSFSIYTNTSKIFNTYQPSGTLGAIHGIRFVTMTWIILGHGLGATAGVANNMLVFANVLKRFTFQAIGNGYVSVDTFFTLSGLLVAYLSLKEMKKRGGAKRLNWGMFYFHRFWRLTPPYMLFLMFYACLSPYLSNGPLWPDAERHSEGCAETWWHNLLYVNNLVRTDKPCFGWGWYLANDMQFYIVSPLMLIPLYYSTVFGGLACLCFVLMSLISVGVIASQNDLNPAISQNPRHRDAIVHIYDDPWCRVGPYAVGVFAGYVLYKTNCKLKIPKMINVVGWTLAVAVGVSVVYGLYDPSGVPQLNNDISALYSATHRTVWGGAVSWVIVACATGNGGFVNTLLSWKALIPLARLTYCAYLVHPVVLLVLFSSKRSTLYVTDLENAFLFCGYLCLSYAVAFIVSLTFEAPMMGLEKALLGRGKHS